MTYVFLHVTYFFKRDSKISNITVPLREVCKALQYNVLKEQVILQIQLQEKGLKNVTRIY